MIPPLLRAAALALLLLGGCAGAPQEAAPGGSRPLARPALPLVIGRLTLVSALELDGAAPRPSGLSGLLVEGDRLLALGDRAMLWRARLVQDGDGRLRAVTGWQATPLRLAEGRGTVDSEALARLADGGLAIASESAPFLLRLDDPADGRLTPLPAPAWLAEAPANRGIEALATLADGRMLLITEGMAAAVPGDLAAAIVGGGAVVRLSYRPAPGFAATGADRLGDDLFVLERRLSLLGGLQSRIVRVDLARAPLEAGGVIEGEELARLGPGTIQENFEGIAATAAPDGGVWLHLVSDDNQLALQRSLLLQLRYDPGSTATRAMRLRRRRGARRPAASASPARPAAPRSTRRAGSRRGRPASRSCAACWSRP